MLLLPKRPMFVDAREDNTFFSAPPSSVWSPVYSFDCSMGILHNQDIRHCRRGWPRSLSCSLYDHPFFIRDMLCTPTLWNYTPLFFVLQERTDVPGGLLQFFPQGLQMDPAVVDQRGAMDLESGVASTSGLRPQCVHSAAEGKNRQRRSPRAREDERCLGFNFHIAVYRDLPMDAESNYHTEIIAVC